MIEIALPPQYMNPNYFEKLALSSLSMDLDLLSIISESTKWGKGHSTLLVAFNSYMSRKQCDEIIRISTVWTNSSELKNANVSFDFGTSNSSHGYRAWDTFNSPEGVDIRIQVSTGGVYRSEIGRNARAIPKSTCTMVLPSITELKATPEEEWVVVHEFGHALGLQHEDIDANKRGTCSIRMGDSTKLSCLADVSMYTQAYEYAYCHFGITPKQLDTAFVALAGSTASSKLDEKSVMRYWFPPECYVDKSCVYVRQAIPSAGDFSGVLECFSAPEATNFTIERLNNVVKNGKSVLSTSEVSEVLAAVKKFRSTNTN